jgi:hypothetical protein
MAAVARCPECEHEFAFHDDDSAAAAECPACGAVLSSASSAPADMAGEARNGENRGSDRFDKWFRSADTVADVREGAMGFSQYGLKSPAADEDAPVAPSAGEKAAFGGGETSDAMTPGDEPGLDLELHAGESATWEDANKMDAMLADIEGDATPADRGALDPLDFRQYDDELANKATMNYAELAAETAGGDSQSPGDASEPVEDTSAARILAVRSVRGKPSKSRLRSLLGTAFAGIIGLALGYYVLLWISGPSGDFLDVANYIPNAIRPPSLRSDGPRIATRRSDESVPAAAANNARRGAEPVPNERPAAERQPEAVQANYETSSVPLGGVAGADDHRYAVPSPATPAPRPEAGAAVKPAVPLRVSGAPTYSAEQVSATLQAARDAAPGLAAGSLDDPAVRRAKGAGFEKLCELALAYTFADRGPKGASEIASLSRDADIIFRRMLVDPRTRGEVARIVPIWIGSPHRSHGGVFFAGNLLDRENRGALVEFRVDSGVGEPLVVLASPDLQEALANLGGPVAVIGVLVDEPQERIPGYAGEARRAIWAGGLLRLDE